MLKVIRIRIRVRSRVRVHVEVSVFFWGATVESLNHARTRSNAICARVFACLSVCVRVIG